MHNFGMYNFNMQNPMNFFSRGMGSIGMGSFGMGNFNAFQPMNFLSQGFGSNNIFQNSFGEPNYDTMAGFGVANTLLGGLKLWANTKIAEKQERKNYGNVVESKNNKIAKLNSDIKGLKEENERYKTNINNLEQEIKDLNIDKLKQNIESYEKQLKEFKKEKSSTIEAALGELLRSAKENLTKAEAEKTRIKREISEKQNAIDANEEKIKAKEAQIQDIESKNEELQKEIDDKILNRADGNSLQRVSEEEFNNTEGKHSNKSIIRTAIGLFRELKEQYDINPTEETKKRLLEVSKRTFDTFEKLGTKERTPFTKACKLMNTYLKEKNIK